MWRADPFQIMAAILLDLLVGDPRGWPHIARLTGKLSVRYEAVLTRRAQRSVTLGFVFWGLVSGTIFAGYTIAYFLCARSARRRHGFSIPSLFTRRSQRPICIATFKRSSGLSRAGNLAGGSQPARMDRWARH